MASPKTGELPRGVLATVSAVQYQRRYNRFIRNGKCKYCSKSGQMFDLSSCTGDFEFLKCVCSVECAEVNNNGDDVVQAHLNYFGDKFWGRPREKILVDYEIYHEYVHTPACQKAMADLNKSANKAEAETKLEVASRNKNIQKEREEKEREEKERERIINARNERKAIKAKEKEKQKQKQKQKINA
jgi:hypothetical protein